MSCMVPSNLMTTVVSFVPWVSPALLLNNLECLEYYLAFNYQGLKRAKASEADFKPFLPLTPIWKYFLTSFTLISKMIKFDLSGAAPGPRNDNTIY